MKIQWAGQNTEPREVLTGTVGQAYEAAVDDASRAGLTVLDVRGDGKLLTEASRPRVFEKSAADVNLMEIEPVDTHQLVRAAVAEARNHLAPCREALQAAHGLLYAQHHVRALKPLKPALEVWMAVCEAVTKAAILMGRDLTKPILNNLSIEDSQHRIVDILDRTRVIFEQRDWSALSSLIETDFLPLVAHWEGVCRILEEDNPPGA